jgi:hypothetical protein
MSSWDFDERRRIAANNRYALEAAEVAAEEVAEKKWQKKMATWLKKKKKTPFSGRSMRSGKSGSGSDSLTKMLHEICQADNLSSSVVVPPSYSPFPSPALSSSPSLVSSPALAPSPAPAFAFELLDDVIPKL